MHSNGNGGGSFVTDGNNVPLCCCWWRALPIGRARFSTISDAPVTLAAANSGGVGSTTSAVEPVARVAETANQQMVEAALRVRSGTSAGQAYVNGGLGGTTYE